MDLPSQVAASIYLLRHSPSRCWWHACVFLPGLTALKATSFGRDNTTSLFYIKFNFYSLPRQQPNLLIWLGQRMGILYPAEAAARLRF